MCIFGTKFQEHCFNISRDILDSVFYHFSSSLFFVITFLISITQKRWYLSGAHVSLEWKRILQKGKRHSTVLWKVFQIISNYFSSHRRFNLPLLNYCLYSLIELERGVAYQRWGSEMGGLRWGTWDGGLRWGFWDWGGWDGGPEMRGLRWGNCAKPCSIQWRI